MPVDDTDRVRSKLEFETAVERDLGWDRERQSDRLAITTLRATR